MKSLVAGVPPCIMNLQYYRIKPKTDNTTDTTLEYVMSAANTIYTHNQISIRCNFSNEHRIYLRCAKIPLKQYADRRSCQLHKQTTRTCTQPTRTSTQPTRTCTQPTPSASTQPTRTCTQPTPSRNASSPTHPKQYTHTQSYSTPTSVYTSHLCPMSVMIVI